MYILILKVQFSSKAMVHLLLPESTWIQINTLKSGSGFGEDALGGSGSGGQKLMDLGGSGSETLISIKFILYHCILWYKCSIKYAVVGNNLTNGLKIAVLL